jgi:hypothetical protein
MKTGSRGRSLWRVLLRIALVVLALTIPFVLALTLLMVFSKPARAAQTASPMLDDPNGVLVEELVVTAQERGPAWWRVSDEDTTVYVLGAPAVLSEGQAWDRSVLERRLTGAHTVILPFNSVGVGLTAAPGIFIALAKDSGGPIEARLPPDLRARFVAARSSIGKPDKRYGLRSELVTAVLLIGDARDAAGLTAAEPGRSVAKLARGRGIRIVTRAYPLGPLLKGALRAPETVQRACLEGAIAEVEAGPERARRAATAWSSGSVADALAGGRSGELCFAAAPGARELDEQLKAETVAAIEAALAKPGQAVAVVQLRPLLARGGVLDRLRAKGLEINTPAEP